VPTITPARITEHVAAAVAERAWQKNISRWRRVQTGLVDRTDAVNLESSVAYIRVRLLWRPSAQ